MVIKGAVTPSLVRPAHRWDQPNHPSGGVVYNLRYPPV